jgi:hypothetical protein
MIRRKSGIRPFYVLVGISVVGSGLSCLPSRRAQPLPVAALPPSRLLPQPPPLQRDVPKAVPLPSKLDGIAVPGP